jgi:hypothetical protein
VEGAASAEANDAGTRAAEHACQAEIFEHNAAHGCVSAGCEVTFFGDEERLAEEPGWRAGTESTAPGGHEQIEDERELLVGRGHLVVRQERKNETSILLAQPASDGAVEASGNEVRIGVEEKQEVTDGLPGTLITRPRFAGPSGRQRRRRQHANAKALCN